jgi:hypothetical protein
MTGRGMGLCAGYASPGFMNAVDRGWFGAGRGGMPWGGGRGRAWGGGRGMGMGRGWWRGANLGWTPYSFAPASVEDEKKYVNEEIKTVQAELDDLKKYLAELDKEKK